MVESFLLLVQIMFINIILSGDNAVVIAMAGKQLPAEQQQKAIRWGTLGAVIFRIIVTFAIVFIMRVPYLQALGSLFLFYISITLLSEEEETHLKDSTTMLQAVQTIILADFMMSLDNVLALVGLAKQHHFLLILGIAVSIPLIIWSSTLIMKILHTFPVLMYIGSGLLGYTAGKMLISDKDIQHFVQFGIWNHWIPIFSAAAVIMIGTCRTRLQHKKMSLGRKFILFYIHSKHG